MRVQHGSGRSDLALDDAAHKCRRYAGPRVSLAPDARMHRPRPGAFRITANHSAAEGRSLSCGAVLSPKTGHNRRRSSVAAATDSVRGLRSRSAHPAPSRAPSHTCLPPTLAKNARHQLDLAAPRSRATFVLIHALGANRIEARDDDAVRIVLVALVGCPLHHPCCVGVGTDLVLGFQRRQCAGSLRSHSSFSLCRSGHVWRALRFRDEPSPRRQHLIRAQTFSLSLDVSCTPAGQYKCNWTTTGTPTVVATYCVSGS